MSGLFLVVSSHGMMKSNLLDGGINPFFYTNSPKYQRNINQICHCGKKIFLLNIYLKILTLFTHFSGLLITCLWKKKMKSNLLKSILQKIRTMFKNLNL